MKHILLICFVCASIISVAQKPVIDYSLAIAEGNIISYKVEMHLSNVPDTFMVAMVKHFEYDDKYWRFIKDFTATAKSGNAKIICQDSALWKIITTGNEVWLSYNIQPPLKKERGSWQPFLTANGALVGGPQSFMYLVGGTQLSSRITINIPGGWTVATGLKASQQNTYYATSVYELTDEPILAGTLKTWAFTINGVSHQIAFYSLPNLKYFDTTQLISGIQKVVEQCRNLFGNLPYTNYTFQLIDGSFGGLEHRNSVTLAANSDELSQSFTDFFAEMAHEYFHSWNLVRIRPAEYGDVTYKDNPLSKELWWSEGVTMLYADLLLRRAGLPVYDSNRIQHLEQLIGSYFSEPGNTKISPGEVSLAANGEPGMLGDYNASTHLQGELLGNMLDIIIRNATNNKRSLDDVMRSMMIQFGYGKGFINKDIEATVAHVCNCNVHDFFEAHIYGNKPIDFNTYLKLIGLHNTITWKDATDEKGNLLPDKNVYAWMNEQHKLLLGITNPESVWGKAGLHTGEEIIMIDDKPVITQREFFNIIGNKNIGDTVSITLHGQTGIYKANVIIAGYKTASAAIAELPTVTFQQKNLRAAWLAGK